MRKSFVLFSCAVVLFALGAFADNTVIEEIVARVNNAIITKSDYEKAKDQIVQEAHDKGENPDLAVSEHQKDILRDLIDQQLLLQKAAELDITGDTELIKRLDEIRKSMGLSSMDDLEEQAKKQGVSFEDFKQNLRNSIVTQSVISREVGSHLQITHEEEEAFYNEHKAELERPEQVELSEILVAPTKPEKEGDKAPDPTPEQLAAAEKKANDLLAQLKKGAKFDEIARQNSDGPTASQGGDLGFFKRGSLAKELEDKTFSMKKGEITDVIRTKQGFVILKVNEHDQAGIPPLKDVENDIQQAIYLKKLQPALRDYLTKLREDAYIDIKPGYVDSAASANQTSPVLVAQATDTGKKSKRGGLKKHKRFLVF